MAVDRDSFLTRFPIFSSADGDLVDAEIAAALKLCNAATWGDQLDDGVMHLVAHRIAIKLPTFAQLVSKDRTTSFLAEYKRMQSELLVGDRVP